MSVVEIVLVIGSVVSLLGSLIIVVVTILNRPSFDYCDKTYKRIDVDEKDYKLLISKIEVLTDRFVELQKTIEELKNGK